MTSASLTVTSNDSRNYPVGHAGKLKYANPQDLPSFPSSGLKRGDAAASAAASLGWASQKSFDHWKSTGSASASAAAQLAKDYKMAPAWQPEYSEAGSKAALLAADLAQRQQPHVSVTSSAWGNSAASIAFKANYPSSANPAEEAVNLRHFGLLRSSSMRAAQGAFEQGARPRATSSPQALVLPPYLDQKTAAANALSAATIAHRPTTQTRKSAPVGQAGAIPFTTMDRLMFTSRPPVKPEIDEQRRADVLHASAVAMAKRMYTQQQKMVVNTKAQRVRSSSFSRHGQSPVRSNEETTPVHFNGLQEAAYRLAQERLSKLHEEHEKSRGFQEYYGSPASLTQRNRLRGIRGKLTRRRSTSDSEVMHDEVASRRIRQQMSVFDSKLSEVDVQKRTRDREALLAAAQRNVKAQLQGMDEKIYATSGKIGPNLTGTWESKVQAAAHAKQASAQDIHKGKVNIGGGKFMDRDAVDEIASRRVQPLLNEIAEKAELERERRAALKLEEERRKDTAEKKKVREKETHDINKKLKDHQKQEEKAKKEEEKTAQVEQKRLAREEKHSSGPVGGVLPPEIHDSEVTTKPLGMTFPKLRTNWHKDKGKDVSPISPSENSPQSDGDTPQPSSKMKNWFRNRLSSRPRAKSSGAGTEREPGGGSKGFIGGAALNRVLRDTNESSSSVGKRSSSMRSPTSARKNDELGESSFPAVTKEAGPASGNAPSVVSLVSSLSSDDKSGEASSQLDAPRPLSSHLIVHGRNSPLKESRFTEMIE